MDTILIILQVYLLVYLGCFVATQQVFGVTIGDLYQENLCLNQIDHCTNIYLHVIKIRDLIFLYCYIVVTHFSAQLFYNLLLTIV